MHDLKRADATWRLKTRGRWAIHVRLVSTEIADPLIAIADPRGT